ncbi:jg17306, partial [Pararge aegeria aegeria]
MNVVLRLISRVLPRLNSESSGEAVADFTDGGPRAEETTRTISKFPAAAAIAGLAAVFTAAAAIGVLALR